VVVAASVAAALLPLAFPFGTFITTSAQADTFALLPWWWLHDHGIALHDLRFLAFGAGVVATALFTGLQARAFAVLRCWSARSSSCRRSTWQRPQGIHVNSVGSLWAGIKVAHRNWIDRAVGHDANVAVLWSGRGDVHTVWENEFFSRSVHTIYDLNAATPGDLPETPVHEVRAGRLADPAGRIVHAQYALAAQEADVEGKASPRISRTA